MTKILGTAQMLSKIIIENYQMAFFKSRNLFCIFISVLASIGLAGDGVPNDAQPNFVFIIADDCTFDDIGCYGGQAKTPHIDQLAKEGMLFKRCFQTAPMCSPTRHNIYTGLYPVKSGAYPNHAFAKPGTQSVCHFLGDRGYRVALSGKTHIAPKTVFPFEYSASGKNPNFAAIENLFDECKESKDPFCLFVCSNEPHSPWNKGDSSAYPPNEIKLPKSFVDTPETRNAFSKYLAEVTFYDQQVGRVLSLLDKKGLEKNTVVMVTTEQGNSFPFAKWTLYDAGLQTALIARWPGKILANSASDAMVEYVDVLPTMLEIAGVKQEPSLDGKSFLRVLQGKADSHKSVVYGLMTTKGTINSPKYYGSRSIRDDQYKLIWNFTPEITLTNACTNSGSFQSWVRKASSGDADAAAKVSRYQNRPLIELYDVRNDPKEAKNLAGSPKHAARIDSMKIKLQQWMDAQGDKGQDTELAANEHQQSWARKKPGNGKKR